MNTDHQHTTPGENALAEQRQAALPVEADIEFHNGSTTITNSYVLELNQVARALAAATLGRRQANLGFPEVAVVGHGDDYDSISGEQTEAVGNTFSAQIWYHLAFMQKDMPAENQVTVDDLAITGAVTPTVPPHHVHVLIDYLAGSSAGTAI